MGYGIFLPPNPEYQLYFEKALKLCLQAKATSIIICGGCSNKDHPGLSEASSIAKLFTDLHPGIEKSIICEDKSLTTIQNLEFSHNRIKATGQALEKITIICDSIRVPKVFTLSLELFADILNFKLSEEDRLNILQDIYLGQDPNLVREISFVYQNLEVKGIPLSQSPQIVSYQIISSMWEMRALKYPKLHQKFINWRKKKWGIS